MTIKVSELLTTMFMEDLVKYTFKAETIGYEGKVNPKEINSICTANVTIDIMEFSRYTKTIVIEDSDFIVLQVNGGLVRTK